MELPDWLHGIALIGKYGDSYVPIVTDASGNLYAVLRGEYAGELKTVALDSEGRISAFVIDSVDAWGRMLTIGNAELAARLGSVDTYDRRGMVHFVDSFEHGLRDWEGSLSGAGAAIAIAPGHALHGGYSCKLIAGSDDEWYAGAYRGLGQTPKVRVGFECAVAFETQFDSFVAQVRVYSTTAGHWAGIRYECSTEDLWYYNSDGGWAKFADLALWYGAPLYWNRLKFVVDLDSGEYERALVNNEESDLSGNACRSLGGLPEPLVEMSFFLYGRDGHNDISYVDGVIFTVAEPEN